MWCGVIGVNASQRWAGARAPLKCLLAHALPPTQLPFATHLLCHPSSPLNDPPRLFHAAHSRPLPRHSTPLPLCKRSRVPRTSEFPFVKPVCAAVLLHPQLQLRGAHACRAA